MLNYKILIKKSALSILIIILCMFALFHITSCAKTEVDENANATISELEFELQENDTYFVKAKNEDVTNIIIPSTFNGKPVKGISAYAFRFCAALTSVTIAGSITEIGGMAFDNCTSLKNITIPNSVRSMGKCVFDGCSQLTSITLSENLDSIPDSAFNECKSLKSITIPESVKSIGTCAFSDCNSLTSIIIPESVESIEEYAFAFCSNLASVTVKGGKIAESAFSSCPNLTAVTIGKGVTYIGEGAFNLCDSLVLAYFEDTVGWTVNNMYLSSIELSNELTAGGYLRDKYCEDCIWRKILIYN